MNGDGPREIICGVGTNRNCSVFWNLCLIRSHSKVCGLEIHIQRISLEMDDPQGSATSSERRTQLIIRSGTTGSTPVKD